MIEQRIKPTVAVDLDGVLARYDGWRGVEHIGEPIFGARDFLKALRKNYRVLIFTTRTNARLNAGTGTLGGLVQLVEDWLVKHKMPFDAIHTGQGKPLAVAYIDDRAVPCRPTQGIYTFDGALGWLDNTRHEWGAAQDAVAKTEECHAPPRDP